jgi:hypothetical protein
LSSRPRGSRVALFRLWGIAAGLWLVIRGLRSTSLRDPTGATA